MARGRSSGDVEIRSCGGEEEKYVRLASLGFWAFYATSSLSAYQAYTMLEQVVELTGRS